MLIVQFSELFLCVISRLWNEVFVATCFIPYCVQGNILAVSSIQEFNVIQNLYNFTAAFVDFLLA
jgi:hypothetical protein